MKRRSEWKKAKAAAKLPEFEVLRDAARDIKNHTLAHLDFYLERYEARVLESGGQFHAATDWDDYAHQICGVMEADDCFTNWSGSEEFYQGVVERPLTKFEKHALRRGHEVRELLYKRI